MTLKRCGLIRRFGNLVRIPKNVFIKYESKLQGFHENRELQMPEILEV